VEGGHPWGVTSEEGENPRLMTTRRYETPRQVRGGMPLLRLRERPVPRYGVRTARPSPHVNHHVNLESGVLSTVLLTVLLAVSSLSSSLSSSHCPHCPPHCPPLIVLLSSSSSLCPHHCPHLRLNIDALTRTPKLTRERRAEVARGTTVTARLSVCTKYGMGPRCRIHNCVHLIQSSCH
jgi:hypothetical protein